MGFTNISEWAKSDKNVVLGDYTKKHRYFMFLGSKTQKQKMLSDLVYEINQYPKGENKKYDASYSPAVQIPMFF